MKKLVLLFIGIMALTLNVSGQEKTVQTSKKTFKFNDQERKVIELQEITVFNVSSNDCYTVENIKFDSIKVIGEDVSQMSWLKRLPSINYHSDNGIDAGYNYFRLRGIDQNKVNMTLNGVPLNEPEDGGFYFNNLGGLVNILDNMQVVNGSTSTKNGSSVLAGGINMNTKRITENMVEVKTLVDRYDTKSISTTWSNMGNINSLVSFNNFSTDGYRYNSYNKTKNLSYILNKNFGKLYVENIGVVTNQKNGMAWLGATKEQIKNNPRTNNNTNLEYDDFTTYHNQLIIKYFFNNNLFLHTNIYTTHLDGKYTTDLDNLGIVDGGIFMNKLFQDWVGNFTNLSYTKNKLTTNVGFNTYYFQRKHQGYDAVDGYKNIGYKRELAPYFKVTYALDKLVFNGNIQYRYVDFDYKDKTPNNTTPDFKKINWNFVNYGVGVTYQVNNKFNMYYSFGKNNREASRLDMFGGEDYYDPSLFIKLASEYVYDHEFGFRFKHNRISLELPFYYMNFKNELALNGQINQQGIHLHGSADNSKRYGMELKFSYVNRLSVDVTTNISRNRISNEGFTYTHILSPNQSCNVLLQYDVNKHFSVNGGFNFIGKMYVDPINEVELKEQYQVDLGCIYKLKDLTVGLGVVNLTDKLNYTNGYMSDGSAYYFTNAPFRVNLKVGYKFNY